MADGVVVEADHARLAPEEAMEAILQGLQDPALLLNVRFRVTNLITGASYIVVDGVVEEVAS
jgi:hypothetical protein